VLLHRLLVAAASAGVGFLLLCALMYAMAHPGSPDDSVQRLACCAVPLAVTVNFAVAVARTDPGTRPRTEVSAVGLGPVRLALLSAVATALPCTLGSSVALLVFLHLRGDITGLPFDGTGAALLATGRPLPLPATLTLLALVPVIASTAAAFALRPRPAGPARGSAEPAAAPAGLPWGAALAATGLAIETYASRGTVAPVGIEDIPATVLAGLALAAMGLAVASPGLTHLCGRLLYAARPSPVRLLAGRVLQEEARRIGRPLGAVCAVATIAVTASALYVSPSRQSLFGPLTGLGAALVTGCLVATLLTAAAEMRTARAAVTECLLRLGAPTTVLRGAAALRAAALLVLFAPLTWALAELTALPLSP
jgi:hypothetical protein